MPNKEQTTHIIDALLIDAKEAPAVKRLASPASILIGIVVVFALLFLLASVMFSPLQTWQHIQETPLLQLEILCATLLTFFSLKMSLKLRNPAKSLSKASLMIISILLLSMVSASFLQATPMENHGLIMRLQESHCVLTLLFTMMAPLAFTFWHLRKGASTKPILSTYLALTGVIGLSYILASFTCDITEAGHQISAHIAPALLLPYLAIFIGRKYLRF